MMTMMKYEKYANPTHIR